MSSPKMEVDVRGKVRNTTVTSSNALLPLFEAIVNGIHATTERFGDDVGKRGEIEVHVERAMQQTEMPTPGRPPIPEVLGFVVTDNGCGFTDKNMDAFCTADTTSKADLGGKGVGRFSWLVVFSHAVVASVYENGDGELRQRDFEFRPTGKGIDKYADHPADKASPRGTAVSLNGVQKRYAGGLRVTLEAMAERVFEHCFSYFVVGRCPRVRLIEKLTDGTSILDVNDKLKDVVLSEVMPLVVGNHQLGVRHAQQAHGHGRKHMAHLCAHQREVTTFALSEVSDLDGTPIALADGKKVVHHVYVSGRPLDEAVNSTRTHLDLPEEMPLLEQAGELDLHTLKQALGAHVNEYLSDTLSAAREENFAQIESHIRTVQPEYRHLLNRIPERLKRVKFTSDRKSMDERLYREEQSWDADVRRRQAEVEERLGQPETSPDELAAELGKLIEEVNDSGKSNLVRYVVKRRAVLKVAQSLLGRGALESHVHKLIFPMRATGDQVAYDDHNLWLVDDTLAFYEHIASDIPFSQNKQAPADSADRPDLLAFKTGDAPYQHVALLEFKRPERKDDNPVEQIVRYAVQLRNGGAKNALNNTMPGIPKSVRIDAFALVTLTPELEAKLRVGPANMVRAEGDWRWTGGVPAENLTIEVLDFQTFVKRAEQRNRAFFAKLGLL